MYFLNFSLRICFVINYFALEPLYLEVTRYSSRNAPINDALVRRAGCQAYKTNQNIKECALTYPLTRKHTQTYQRITSIPKNRQTYQNNTHPKHNRIPRHIIVCLYIPLHVATKINPKIPLKVQYTNSNHSNL